MLNAIPKILSIAFLVAIAQLTLKLTHKIRGSRIAKTILKKNNKVGGLTFYNFETY